MEETILELKAVSVHYAGVQALDRVDVSVRRGEIVALMGPNGAGKSTVLKAAFGIAPVSAGRIFFNGTPIEPIVHRMAGMGIVLVPQGRRVFAHLTVEENLEIGGFIIKDRDELRRRIDEVMGLFPVLKKKRREKARTFSGGEQQMLAIARGLIVNPRVLMLDEPSLGLSPKVVKEVFAKIKEINGRHGTAIMVVEHNLKSLLDMVDRAYVLDKGRVVAEEPSERLLASGILERVFLGKAGPDGA